MAPGATSLTTPVLLSQVPSCPHSVCGEQLMRLCKAPQAPRAHSHPGKKPQVLEMHLQDVITRPEAAGSLVPEDSADLPPGGNQA